LSDCIADWRKKTVGAFLYIQELTDFYRVFRSFVAIASKKNTGEALEAVLDATKLLGYPEGRLYVIDTASGDLVSQKWYGANNLKKADDFEQGGIRASHNEAHKRTWKSIDENASLVFCYDPDGREGKVGRTSQGLEFIITTDLEYRDYFGKTAGNFWIDIPLRTEDGPLGKLILPCDEHLRPESFELLKVLVNSNADLLEDLARQEREQHERDLFSTKVATAEKVMGDMAHNIATKFAALPGYLSFYRHYEKQLPELKEINDNFKHALDQTQAIVRRAKERLSPIAKLTRERIELTEYLERLLKSHLQQGEYSVISEIGPIEMNLDAHLLEIALSELIENSKTMHEDPERLKIEIRIRDANKADGTVRIIYRDNGPGVDDEIRLHIFEDFFSHRPSSDRASTGLGLGFAKRVIEAHGGNIQLGSSKNGAEFLIVLAREASNQTIETTNHVDVVANKENVYA
jgi:signal transduction histidine kinase